MKNFVNELCSFPKWSKRIILFEHLHCEILEMLQAKCGQLNLEIRHTNELVELALLHLGERQVNVDDK